MRWGEKFLLSYLSFLLLLGFFFLAICTAKAQELPPPPSSFQTLDQLLNQLEQETQTLSEGSAKLQDLLSQARGQLITLSLKLDESQTVQNELKYSLEQSEARLTAFELSWKKERARLSLELWIWRGGTALAVTGLILALVK